MLSTVEFSVDPYDLHAKLGTLATIGSETKKTGFVPRSVHRRINDTDIRGTVKPPFKMILSTSKPGSQL